MAILHTVNQSPFNHQALAQCLQRLCPEDTLLLLEDGVYGALKAQPYAEQLKIFTQCYAIADDINARGLGDEELIENIQLIDYPKFVELSIANSLIQSWY